MVELIFNAPPLGDPTKCRAFLPSCLSRFDYSDLDRFASQRIILSGFTSVYPDQADIVQPYLGQDMLNMIRSYQFNSERDYYVLVGDPLIMAAGMWALSKSIDKVTTLRYDNLSRSYWALTISI